MKVAARSFASLLGDLTRTAGILLYGADVGLVRDRSRQACRAVLGQDQDPFRLTVLPREDHGRLREELTSLPLGGGRRVIRVLDAADSLAVVIETVLPRAADLLVILEASSLTPRSKLRSMAERSATWAAIPCFPEAGTLSAEITQRLAQESLTTTPEALVFLAAELGGDFARRQSELEKLSLFATDVGVIDLSRASASCAGHMDASLSLVVNAALSGDRAATDRALAELHREGASGPGLLAVLSAELQRVLRVHAEMARGNTLEEACRSLMPPVYPRQASGFLAAVRRWPMQRLLMLGEAVRAADLACKRAGARDFTIAAQLVGLLARA